MKMLKSFAFLLTFAVASAANAIVVGVIDPNGGTMSNATTAANLLEPSTVTSVTSGTVSASTSASLFGSYDALIFSWPGSSGYPASFWTDTLLGYIELGGGVIFDGAQGAVSALAGSGISTFGASTYSSGTQTVTDNAVTSEATVHGANHHLGGLSGNSSWTEFLSNGTTTLGMYASFGAGKIIVTSTDFFWHGGASNMDFMADELAFVTSSVPEPMPLALLALGLIGLAYSRKRA